MFEYKSGCNCDESMGRVFPKTKLEFFTPVSVIRIIFKQKKYGICSRSRSTIFEPKGRRFNLASFECVIKMCLNTKVVGVLAELIDRHFHTKNLEVPTLEYKTCCYCGRSTKRHFPKEKL